LKGTHPVWALGTMSGTSLDGVDAAMILTDGHVIHEFGPSAYRAYTDAERVVLRAALGCWPNDPNVAAAAEVIEAAHAEIMARFSEVEIAGFHGQTLAHDPGGRGTHQTGNGALLAEVLDLPVAWDFRSADVELGGQGAPLAPFYHFACAGFIKASTPIALLNLGGVGNITYVDPSYSTPEAEGALLAFDTGPANAPINDLMMARLAKPYDENGACAAAGTRDRNIVDRFLTHSYFQRIPPKSLDRDSFADLPELVVDLDTEDAAATLLSCAVGAVGKSIQHLPNRISTLYVTGGGRKNHIFMKRLQAELDVNVVDIDDTGLDGDMLEAQAFAHLAVRVARKLPTSCKSTTGVPMAVGGGIISYPGDFRGISKSDAASSNPSN
jgi:anhydro-N-acetylmuramic acid kinase